MKKNIICLSIAIVKLCFFLFLWWLSGNKFERSDAFAFYLGLSVFFSLFVYLMFNEWLDK